MVSNLDYYDMEDMRTEEEEEEDKEFEEALQWWFHQEEEFKNHIPEEGERFSHVCMLDPELIPDLTPDLIDYFFKDAYIPAGCEFEEEEMGFDYVKRTYIFKGEEENDI